MPKMTTQELTTARALLALVPRGPWQWYGNTRTNEVYLATVNHGRVYVMDFARWGMQSAQPRFQVSLKDGSALVGEPGLLRDGIMRSLEQLRDLGPQFDRSNTGSFTGVGHPVAKLMQEAPSLVAALLNHIEEQDRELASLRGSPAGQDADDVAAWAAALDLAALEDDHA